jgi:hypothetical protein
MHAAKRAFPRIRRDARLGDHRLQPELPKLVLTEGAGKEAALVGPPLEVDVLGSFVFCIV